MKYVLLCSGGGAKAVGLEGEQGRGPTAARGVLVAAAERTLTVLSLFVLEDDAATGKSQYKLQLRR